MLIWAPGVSSQKTLGGISTDESGRKIRTRQYSAWNRTLDRRVWNRTQVAVVVDRRRPLDQGHALVQWTGEEVINIRILFLKPFCSKCYRTKS